MAGTKRKLDAVHGSATSSAGNTSSGQSTSRDTAGDDTSNTRVTRNLRSSRDTRAGQNDNAKNANTATSSTGAGNQTSTATNKPAANRPSRIVKFKSPALARVLSNANQETPATPATAAPAPTPSAPTSTRETRNSRARAAAPAASTAPAALAVQTTSQLDDQASASAVPETPRAKRVKRGSVAEETPRTTRQSARLKAQTNENGASETPAKQSEASPSTAVAPNTRTRNRSRQVADSGADGSPHSASGAPAVKSSPSDDAAPKLIEASKTEDSEHAHPKELTSAESPKGTVSPGNTNEPAVSEIEQEPKVISTRSSPILSRKRRSWDSDATGPFNSPSKKPKLEETALERASEPPLPNGDENNVEDALSAAENATESKTAEESRQITEEVEGSTTPDNATESTVGKAVRGGRNRGRGRGGRSRAPARSGANRRGRGANRATRTGRTTRRNDNSSDIEFERSPSPSAATQKLRDRQRELDKAFRKVAAAQRFALAVLATQSERRLARDKNAHRNVPEYDEVNMLLKEQLRQRQETLRRDYDLKVAQENRMFAANTQVIEERFRASARYIQEEHLLASHGEYMTFIEGRRAAEDDEHTETDGSDTENERERRPRATREVYRGFDSSFVRDPAGAVSYERAAFGWDDFVQRAKLGDDIDPQMKEMREAGPLAGLSVDDIIKMLLDATGIIEVRDGLPVKETRRPAIAEVRPTALTALADIAAAELPRPTISQPTPRLPVHRAILPQPSQHHQHPPPPQPPQLQLPPPHAHPEPRPFVLPPPTPRGQPRRLLPAGQQMPPIGEPLGLPDPFASRAGPPQLPPPPGSNFQRPPLPGYLAGHHPHPGLYYPPPPPPPRPPY